MKKFNKLFVAGKTWVLVSGEYTFRKVKEVHDTRNWIKVEGLCGSFQRCDVVAFSNKDEAPSIAPPSKYIVDACGKVYERGEDANIFVGNLNGRKLYEFVKQRELSSYCITD